MKFKYIFSFAEPVYFDVPATQLLSYYPHLNINSLAKSTRLAQQPSLHQLASSATQQISIPVYTPIYNQKQLVPSVKIPYSTIVSAPLTTKVGFYFQYANAIFTEILSTFYFHINIILKK